MDLQGGQIVSRDPVWTDSNPHPAQSAQSILPGPTWGRRQVNGHIVIVFSQQQRIQTYKIKMRNNPPVLHINRDRRHHWIHRQDVTRERAQKGASLSGQSSPKVLVED